MTDIASNESDTAKIQGVKALDRPLDQLAESRE